MGLFDGPRSTTLVVRDDPTAGLRLAVGRVDNGVADSDVVVLDELTLGQRLGVIERITAVRLPNPRPPASERMVLCGIDTGAAMVTVEWSDGVSEGIETTEGIWLSDIRLFRAGLSVTVHWDHGDG